MLMQNPFAFVCGWCKFVLVSARQTAQFGARLQFACFIFALHWTRSVTHVALLSISLASDALILYARGFFFVVVSYVVREAQYCISLVVFRAAAQRFQPAGRRTRTSLLASFCNRSRRANLLRSILRSTRLLLLLAGWGLFFFIALFRTHELSARKHVCGSTTTTTPQHICANKRHPRTRAHKYFGARLRSVRREFAFDFFLCGKRERDYDWLKTTQSPSSFAFYATCVCLRHRESVMLCCLLELEARKRAIAIRMLFLSVFIINQCISPVFPCPSPYHNPNVLCIFYFPITSLSCHQILTIRLLHTDSFVHAKVQSNLILLSQKE